MFAYQPHTPTCFDNPILEFVPPIDRGQHPQTKPVILEHIKAVRIGDTVYFTGDGTKLAQLASPRCHIIQIRPDQLARLPIPRRNSSTGVIHQYGIGGTVRLKGITHQATITEIIHKWDDVWARCEYTIHSQFPMVSYRKLTDLEMVA